MPKRKLTQPVYVLPASVDVGDTIRVTRVDRDTEVSTVGVVGAIHGRTLSTPEGVHLLTWEPGVKGARVTLLARAERTQVALFGDELLEETNKRLV